MKKTEFSIQIDTAEQKKMSEEPMKQEEAVSKVHEELEKQEPLIELRNIYKIYYMGDEEVHANDGISLSINKGEFVAIVGKSGSGKSTLMNILGALDVPTEGEYFLGGEDVADMSDNELAEIRNRMISTPLLQRLKERPGNYVRNSGGSGVSVAGTKTRQEPGTTTETGRGRGGPDSMQRGRGCPRGHMHTA